LNNWTSQIVRIQQDLIANERIEAERLNTSIIIKAFFANKLDS
jgi:hypothetical protein